MIVRTWRGAIRAADADTYLDYVRRTGFAGYASTPGNRGAILLYRIDNERAEILTISIWESLEAVRGFAGEDVMRAVFYPEDDRFLIERDPMAQHYTVAAIDLPVAITTATGRSEESER